jgi:hypothetical protein
VDPREDTEPEDNGCREECEGRSKRISVKGMKAVGISCVVTRI